MISSKSGNREKTIKGVKKGQNGVPFDVKNFPGQTPQKWDGRLS